MSKEPNGTLVMATCKCRENNTNLVMTRVWFEEQLEAKIQQGIKQEHERIIKLLQDNLGYLVSCSAFDIIDLVKGQVTQCECDPCGDETCTCQGKRCDFCKAQDA